MVAAGCLAERYGAELAESLPEAQVLSFDDYADIAARLDAVAAGQRWDAHQPRDRRKLLPITPVTRAAAGAVLPGHGTPAAGGAIADLPDGVAPASGPRVLRRRLGGGPVAPLKLASGCDRRCSFCAIPAFRGAFVSRPPADLLAEAAWLAEHGVRELVLVSENSTSYGKDLGDLRLLETLLPQLAAVPGIARVRVSYLQPAEIRPGLVEVMASTPGVAPYFDLSFQHASGPVLRAMRRFGDRERFPGLLGQIRALAPQAGVRSNFIVGFPGETEDDVAELERFLHRRRGWTRSACSATPTRTAPRPRPARPAACRGDRGPGRGSGRAGRRADVAAGRGPDRRDRRGPGRGAARRRPVRRPGRAPGAGGRRRGDAGLPGPAPGGRPCPRHGHRVGRSRPDRPGRGRPARPGTGSGRQPVSLPGTGPGSGAASSTGAGGGAVPAAIAAPSVLNVANALTVLRLVLVPVFVALLVQPGAGWRIAAFVAFGVASLTDLLDGELARRRGLVTDFGKIADPIADKALTGSALVTLSLLGELPWWVTVVILVRELGVTVLRFWVIRHGVIAASRGGKAKTSCSSSRSPVHPARAAGLAAGRGDGRGGGADPGHRHRLRDAGDAAAPRGPAPARQDRPDSPPGERP